jgi:putative NADH-flavin reductase
VKVLILGATGGLGRLLLPKSLDTGHQVTILVRDPASVGVTHDRLHVLRGDALDPVAVEEAVQGQDAVISCLGRRNHRPPTTFFSDTTRILIGAMEKHHVKRLICVTGIGAGDSKGHGGFFYDRVVYPFITKQTYIDKDRQEELIRRSSLDWILVRPAVFTNGPERNNLRVATDLKGVTISRISRADTAAFLVRQLTDNRYLHKTPLIGY